MTDRADVDRSIAAWDETVEGLIGLGTTLTDEEWSAQTECPAWTVKDIYAHLVGGEMWMSQGHPAPPQGLAAIADEPVAERAGASGPQVLAELREVFALRRAQLRANPPDPNQPTETAYRQRVTLGILLRLRAFDAWVHEQDVRRAVARPGNLATASAHVSRDVFLLAMPRVIARVVGAPAGSSVRFAVSGEVPFDVVIAVDGDRRGHLMQANGSATTVTLAMDWETFARLGAGRIPASRASVQISGDEELAARVLANLSVTP